MKWLKIDLRIFANYLRIYFLGVLEEFFIILFQKLLANLFITLKSEL